MTVYKQRIKGMAKMKTLGKILNHVLREGRDEGSRLPEDWNILVKLTDDGNIVIDPQASFMKREDDEAVKRLVELLEQELEPTNSSMPEIDETTSEYLEQSGED